MPTRRQIVDQARMWLGTPFHHQGRLKGRRVDCAGLLLCVCQELGAGVPFGPYLNYDPYPTDDTVLRECRKNFREIPVKDIRPGDILCMRTPVPCHVGFVTDLAPGLGIIHAYNAARKVVEHTIDAWWQQSIEAAFLFPGVED